MQIIARESYIERRVKIGEWTPMLAMALLLASVFVSISRPEWLSLTMALTLLGFLLSLVGSHFLHRFVGQTAHHKTIPAALKGLNDEYTLLMYKLSVPFVLVEPGGLTAFLVKNISGEIRYEGGKWQHRQPAKLLRQIGGQESLGRPEVVVQYLEQQLRKQLEKRLPEEMGIPVRGVVLFTHPDAQVDADEAPIPALHASKLKGWLRSEGRWPRLPAETRHQLEETLGITEAT